MILKGIERSGELIEGIGYLHKRNRHLETIRTIRQGKGGIDIKGTVVTGPSYRRLATVKIQIVGTDYFHHLLISLLDKKMASINGLQNNALQVNTLDGLTNVYVDGTQINPALYVKYIGNTQPLDMSDQKITTTYYATTDPDVVNLKVLSDAVAFITGGVSNSYLNKITSTSQTVVAPVEFQGALTLDAQPTLKSGLKLNAPTSGNWTITAEYIDAYTQNLVFTSSTGAVIRMTGEYGFLKSTGWSPQRVAIVNSAGELITSSVTDTELSYIAGLTSSAQTQINNRLKLDGSNANTNIVLGSYKVQSSAVPSTGDDYTNKTYVDSAISGAGSLYVLKSGDSMSGTLSMGANKVTSSYTPVNADDLTRKGYVDTQLALYLPLTGGTLSGGLTISSGALTANTRLLGVPDGASNGNFWIGLTGSDTEVNRLAIDIVGNQTTGTVSKVTISKPLYLSDPTVNRVLAIDSQNKVFSTIVSTTEIAYLSGVTNSIQTQLDGKVNKSGDTMTGNLKNVGGEFWPYTGGDVNKSCRLFANNGDGADYTTYNGGLKSWYGIAFYSAYDSTVRHVFNTRDGSSKQTGQIDCGSLTTDGTITTTGIGTNAGVLAKRYYLSARGDNQDEDAKIGDNKFGPWYGVGDSGIPGFTGNPCLAGFYGCALRTGSGYLVLTGGGKVGIGSTNPSYALTVTGDISCSGTLLGSSMSAKNWTRQDDYRAGMKPSQQDAGSMGYYFGQMGNDGTGSYSDMLCFNSWADGSAGKVNLIMYNKGGSGIRQYQGDYGSTSKFTTWYDCVMTDANSPDVGITGTVSIGLSSATKANIKFSNAFSHIDNSAGEVYLFTGYNGHMSIGRNTTRNATTCNLALGVASTDEAQIISASTDGSAYLPMSFAGSSFTFVNGNIIVGSARSGLYDSIQWGRTTNQPNIQMGNNFIAYASSAGSWASDALTGDMVIRTNSQAIRFNINNGGASSLVIKSNGNIGIGTSNPLSSLYSYNGGTSGWKGWGYFGNEERGAVIGTYDNKVYVGGHTAALNAWQDMYLNPGGKVCIGNYPMTYKLNVEGDAYATGSLLFGSGGSYSAGCIYSDSSWGCIIRAKIANPAVAKFLWSDYYDNHQMRITNNGVLNFTGGASAHAVPNNISTTPGQVVIGGTDRNYGTGWQAGLLMECSEQTGITVHDSGEKLASFMYYDTDNRFYMGKDAGSGWGATPIQIESTLYYSNPPAQSRGATAGYGAVLGWDVIDKRVVATTVEGYHFGPYSDNLQVNWNFLSRASQFYKSFNNQGLLIHGVATNYRDSAGFQNVSMRLYNQSTGQYFYFATYIYTNLSWNHSPIPFAFEAGGIPAGWYDVMFYVNSGYGYVDGNDAISATFLLLPVSLTSP